MGDKEDVVPKHVQIAQSFFPAGASDFFAIIGAEGKGVELMKFISSQTCRRDPNREKSRSQSSTF